jgi:hypothetical protein
LQSPSTFSHRVPCPESLACYALMGILLNEITTERSSGGKTVRVSTNSLLRLKPECSLEDLEHAMRVASRESMATFYCDPVKRTIGAVCEFDADPGNLSEIVARLDCMVAQSMPELIARCGR